MILLVFLVELSFGLSINIANMLPCKYIRTITLDRITLMKKIFFVVLITMLALLCRAQNTLTSLNSGNQLWIKLGDLALPQGGSDCFLRIVGGSGYNAFRYQQGYVELHMRTSNGVSLDENGYAFSATAVSYGRNHFLSDIRIVPNAIGVSASSFSIYVHCGPYPGNTYFNVEAPTGVWTYGLSSSAIDPGGYNVAFEHVINNDLFTIGNLGIGTLDTKGYKLAVNGDIRTKEIKVEATNWPDYVFEPAYKLPSLYSIKNYVDHHRHLPDIPSEKEVAEGGVSLGRMNEALLKKVEELTLYMIQQQRQIDDLRKEVKALRAREID